MINTLSWAAGYVVWWIVVLLVGAKALIRISQSGPIWTLVERFDRKIITAAISVSVLLMLGLIFGVVLGYLTTGWKFALVGLSAFSLSFAYPVIRYVDTLLGAIRASP